jgi:hypothetical protein
MKASFVVRSRNKRLCGIELRVDVGDEHPCAMPAYQAIGNIHSKGGLGDSALHINEAYDLHGRLSWE